MMSASDFARHTEFKNEKDDIGRPFVEVSSTIRLWIPEDYYCALADRYGVEETRSKLSRELYDGLLSSAGVYELLKGVMRALASTPANVPGATHEAVSQVIVDFEKRIGE